MSWVSFEYIGGNTMWQGERIPLPFSLIHSIDLTTHTQNGCKRKPIERVESIGLMKINALITKELTRLFYLIS
jgi:hypothetical protein